MNVILFIIKLPILVPPTADSVFLVIVIFHNLFVQTGYNLDLLVEDLMASAIEFTEIEHIMSQFQFQED